MADPARKLALVVRDLYENGFVNGFFAGLGGLGTAVAVIGLILPGSITGIPVYVWMLVLAVVVCGNIAVCYPRRHRAFAFAPGLWSVELMVGDLLSGMLASL